LIPVDEATSNMEQLIGLFLTHLSGLSARCGGRDLAVHRAIDKAVFEMRVEISEACTKMADQRGEPPLDDAHDDRRRGPPTGRAHGPLHCGEMVAATAVDTTSPCADAPRRGLRRIADTLDAVPYVTMCNIANLNAAMRGSVLDLIEVRLLAVGWSDIGLLTRRRSSPGSRP
jgi:hypothetical protein